MNTPAQNEPAADAPRPHVRGAHIAAACFAILFTFMIILPGFIDGLCCRIINLNTGSDIFNFDRRHPIYISFTHYFYYPANALSSHIGALQDLYAWEFKIAHGD